MPLYNTIAGVKGRTCVKQWWCIQTKISAILIQAALKHQQIHLYDIHFLIDGNDVLSSWALILIRYQIFIYVLVSGN